MLLSNGAPDVHFAEAPSAIRKNALAEAYKRADECGTGSAKNDHASGARDSAVEAGSRARMSAID
jgi:hypothetical protein